MLFLQVTEHFAQNVRLVEHGDGEVEAGEYAHRVPNELGRAGVVAADVAEQRTSLGNLREQAAASQASATQRVSYTPLLFTR